MHRQLRRALAALKERGSLSYARMATMVGFCDINCIITKATSPDDQPPSDRYINQLLTIFSLSPSSSFRSFSISFSRRFMRTRSWRVALKCLILLHRLLRSLPQIRQFRDEIISARMIGLLCLSPCAFADSSSLSFPEDYSIFIRLYASLLDEAFDCYIEEVEEGETLQGILQEKMEIFGRLMELLPQLQSLIDRVLDCQPTPVATQKNLVQSALKLIIHDSFVWYKCLRKELLIVLDNFLQLPYWSCSSAFNIYKKAAIQTTQLSELYNWYKFMGIYSEICEFPYIDKIPEIHVIEVEKLLNSMWDVTESTSSSTSLPLTSSPLSLVESESEKTKTRLKTIVSHVWEKFDDDKAEKSGHVEDLIRFDEVRDTGRYKYSYDDGKILNSEKLEINGWHIQIYNPIFNPNQVYGGSSTNPMHPWGL